MGFILALSFAFLFGVGPAPVAPRVPYRPHSAGPVARRGRTPYIRPIRCPPPTWRGGGTAPFGGGAPSGCIYRCGPPARDWPYYM